MTRQTVWEKLQKCSEDGEVPSVDTFSNYCGISKASAQNIFNSFVKEGRLMKLNEQYYFNDLNPEESSNFDFFKIVSGLIGAILIIVSIHFTFEFNKLSLPSVWAFLLSVAVVLFMSIAFVIRSRTQSVIKRQLIVFLWFLGICYSVFTAVSGQFNYLRKYVSQDDSKKIVKLSKVYNEELDFLKNKQNELSHWRIQEKLYNDNPDLKLENPGTWKQIVKGNNELISIENQILELNKTIVSNIEKESFENRSVFDWIYETLGISENVIQFIMILFPALFIDLSSTMLMDFAFGRKE